MLRQLLGIGSRLLCSHHAPIIFVPKNPLHPDCDEGDICIHDGTRLLSCSRLARLGNLSANHTRNASRS